MARIIPTITNSDKVANKTPDWMNLQEIVNASAPERNATNKLMTKLASQEKANTTTSYACTGCSKVFSVDNPTLKAQATLANNKGSVIDYTCPNCGNGLEPYHKIAKVNLDPGTTYAEQTSKRVDLSKKASGTYNTFSDMHFVLRAVQELTNFASKQGMSMPRARYIKAEHIKQAGQQYPVLNDIQCEIEWTYGRKQKARVMASIAYDIAGKFIYPKIFKTADGQQHPFDKDYIASLEKIPNFERMMKGPKKSDIPTFRKPDITRFRAFASMNEKELKEGYEKHVEKKKAKGKEPKSFEDWKMKQQEKKEASLKLAVSPPGRKHEVEEIAEKGTPKGEAEAIAWKQYEEDGGSEEKTHEKKSYQQTAPMGQTPTQPSAQPVNYTPGQQVVNPTDGKVYNVKTPSSGTGMVVTDPQTGQDGMIPQNQLGNVKPAVKTTAHLKTAEEMANDLMENFLHGEIGEEEDEIQQHMEMMRGDVTEIEKAKNLLEQTQGDGDHDKDDDFEYDNDYENSLREDKDDNLGSEGDDDVILAEKLMNQMGDKFEGDNSTVQTDEHSEELSDGEGGYGTGYFTESSKKK